MPLGVLVSNYVNVLLVAASLTVISSIVMAFSGLALLVVIRGVRQEMNTRILGMSERVAQISVNLDRALHLIAEQSQEARAEIKMVHTGLDSLRLELLKQEMEIRHPPPGST